MTDPSSTEQWITGFAALASAGSALAAFLSWRSSRSNNEIAQSTNKIADAVAQIERDRWHREVTPKFRITARVFGSKEDVGWIRLELHLDGPFGLGQLDSVTLRIRDDQPDRKPQTAGSPTQEEIANTIWGPLRLNPDTEGVDRIGRSAAPQPLDVGECLVFSFEKTLDPHWSSPDTWRREYRYPQRPWKLRLAITCTKNGFHEWHFPVEVDIQPDASLGEQTFHIS